jgi:Uncharacterized protein conserved in bacteria
MDRNNRLSYIRAAACIGIVFLHAYTMCSMVFDDRLSGVNRILINLVPYLMMWAVPCFVMVTGALLLDKNRDVSIKKVLTKYIPRVLIVLVLFSIIFRLLDIWMNKEAFSISFIGTALKKMYMGTGWAHLWYLYLLIGLYLFMPFYKKMADNLSSKDISFLICIYILFISVLPLINDLTGVKSGFYLVVNSIFPAYLFIGHMIVSRKWKLPGTVYALGILLGNITIILLTYISLNKENKELSEMLTKYLGAYSFLPVIILSVGWFGLVNTHKSQDEANDISINEKKGLKSIICRILLSIDRCSFGIYLTHLIFLRYVYKCTGFNPTDGCGFLKVAGVALATFFISWLLVFVLRKGKLMQKIL